MKVPVVRKTIVEVEACDRCRIPKREVPRSLKLTWDTPEPLLEQNQPIGQRRELLLCESCCQIVFRALAKRAYTRKPEAALVGSACCSDPDADKRPKRQKKKH
ncbi:MAG: hypothetical protein PHE83_19265 [Opitutaceae bacterium]|nr:hypothetical protein [Opitutaceae bacterium]